ncbi:YlbG family protein [Aerococcaceae bacterium DSM 111020]|nr:YlbG family protein [Aerococcaceae bacterium DSM 111020]
MTFEMIDRQEIVVNLYSTRNTRPLQHYGHVQYVSRRMKYAIVYINKEVSDQLIEEIEKIDFVKSVSLSPKKEIDMNFEQVLGEDNTDFIRSLSGNYHERSLDDIVASFKSTKSDNPKEEG